MEVVDIPIRQLVEAAWNPNQMDEDMVGRLRASLLKYGLVENLVVRAAGDGLYEVLSGNQRLKVLKEMGVTTVPCVVVELRDAQAMLLSQVLNRIRGEDDFGVKAELVRRMLDEIPEGNVLSLLPETEDSLRALSSLGQEDLAEHLEAWERAQEARLRHLTFQLSDSQKEVVEEALERVVAGVTKAEENPNKRGNALYLLCRTYLETIDAYRSTYTQEDG